MENLIIDKFVSDATDMRNFICGGLFDSQALQNTSVNAVVEQEASNAHEKMNNLLFDMTVKSSYLHLALSEELSSFRKRVHDIVETTYGAATQTDGNSEVRVLGLPKSLADQYVRERIHADEIIEQTLRSVEVKNGAADNASQGCEDGKFFACSGSLTLSDTTYSTLHAGSLRRVAEMQASESACVDTVSEARRVAHWFDKRVGKMTRRYVKREQRASSELLRRRFQLVANETVRQRAYSADPAPFASESQWRLALGLDLTFVPLRSVMSMSSTVPTCKCKDAEETLQLPFVSPCDGQASSSVTSAPTCDSFTFANPQVAQTQTANNEQANSATQLLSTTVTNAGKTASVVAVPTPSYANLPLPPKKKRFEYLN